MALFPYQEPAAESLYNILLTKGAALDASDTGVGKTYVAVHVAKRLGLPVGIVCPKAVIPSWQRVCKLEGVEPVFILNYETLVRGNTDYLFREKKSFTWNFAGLIVWDEVQRCKSYDSLNCKMLMAAWETQIIRCLCLSATAFQNPLEMRALGFVLGLHKNFNYWHWVISNGARKDRWGGFAWRGSTAQLEAIHKSIFPARGVRIRIKDLKDAFPENQIIAEPLDLGNEKEINAIYSEAQEALDDLKAKQITDYPSAFTIILRARQRAEVLKVPILVELAEDLIKEGKSVIIFANFNETLNLLSKYLNTDCMVRGQDNDGKQQSPEDRQNNLDKFQNNESSIILCNIQAGGVGINLHDLSGDHPRVVLLCPTYNAVDLRQALGRAYRAGAKSSVTQRLVYAAGTVEERVCARVQAKLNNIDLLNDNEVSPLIWQNPTKTSDQLQMNQGST